MSILSQLLASGATSAQLPGLVSGLAGGGGLGGSMFSRQKVVQLCGTILANNSNPAIVINCAEDLVKLPGIPASVSALASQLITMAGNPGEVMQIVAAIETAEGHQGLGALGLGLL